MIADLWMVLVAGAVGGLLSYMIEPRSVELDWGVLPGLLKYALLGAAASHVAVYVLDVADPQLAMRCLGLALVAGMAWKPVIDAAKELVLSRPQRAAEAEARSKASALHRLAAKLAKKPGNAALVLAIGAKGSNLIGRLSEVRHSPARTRALDAINSAIDAIAATKTTDDAAAFAAISGIFAASVRGDGAVLDHVLDSAMRLPVTKGSAFEQQQQDLQRLAQLR